MKVKHLLFLFALTLVSCGEKINFDNVIANMQFIAVYTNSNPDKVDWQGPVAVYQLNSPQMTQFVDWLRNSSDWKPDFQSYQIPSMMVESDNFALFFFGNYVNLVLGDELYSKQLKEGEFDYLLPNQ